MGLVAKRKTLFDAIFVSRMDGMHTAERAAALGPFGLTQMTPAGAGAQHLASRSDFKPLGGRFLRFNAFGTSHNSSKRARNIVGAWARGKRYFAP